MNATAPLLQDISRFYQRWHRLEATFGPDNGAILDFDFCPREDIRALEPPFSNRLEALRSLEELREQLTSNPMKSFANFSYLSLKLEGASAFLRALMGERWEFGRYLRATMGIDPVPMPADAIAEVRERLEARLSRLGIPHSEEGRAAFEEALVMREMEGFEQRLQLEATRWVDRIQRRVGLNTTPRYAIESAHEDAYWANWIDGSVDGPIRLRINLHPRISYHRGAETNLAVHEIGGHAMHVLEMDAARRRGEIDAPSLNLTVHSCEAFQMEGLAQSVLQLVGEEEEIPEALEIDLELRALHGMLMNNAHLALEAGVPITAVVTEALAAGPFLRSGKVLSDLRDRGRHPLYRAYIFVYEPSRTLFLSARKLPRGARLEFLRRMYTRLWTPDQIRDQLEALVARPPDSEPAQVGGTQTCASGGH